MEDDGSADTDTNKQIFVEFRKEVRMIAIILQVILIALNAVFTCAETAIVSLNDNQLGRDGKKGMKQKSSAFIWI